MPRKRKLFYIASEAYESRHPQKRAGVVYPVTVRKGG